MTYEYKKDHCEIKRPIKDSGPINTWDTDQCPRGEKIYKVKKPINEKLDSSTEICDGCGANLFCLECNKKFVSIKT